VGGTQLQAIDVRAILPEQIDQRCRVAESAFLKKSSKNLLLDWFPACPGKFRN